MADVWANYMACHPRATCHIAGCSHLANQRHDRATLQSVIIPFAILKIVVRQIFFVFNAVWALTSGGFRIVSVSLVFMFLHYLTLRKPKTCFPLNSVTEKNRFWCTSGSGKSRLCV